MTKRNVGRLGMLALACASLLVLSGCTKKSGSTAPPPGTKGGKLPGVPKVEPVTAAAVNGVVNTYVTTHSIDNSWSTIDPVTNQQLALTWVRHHDDMLRRTGDNTYVALTQFRAPDGTVYDVDVSLMGNDADSLTVTGSEIRAVNDVVRYTWIDSNGIHTKQVVTTTQPG